MRAQHWRRIVSAAIAVAAVAGMLALAAALRPASTSSTPGDSPSSALTPDNSISPFQTESMTANPTATDRTTSSVDPSPTVAQQETPAEDETTPSGLEPPTYSTTVKPDRLPELAQAISDLGRDSGYAQARLDYDAGTIEFLWSGPVPVDVQTLADTNDDGIKVTFTSAKYSLQELEAAMKELSALADELEDQVPFWGWGPNEDFSGLLVQIEGSETPSDDVLAQIRNRTGIDNISIELM